MLTDFRNRITLPQMSSKNLVRVLPLLLLTIGLFTTLIVLKQNLDNRQHASETDNTSVSDATPDIISDIDKVIQPYTTGQWNVNKDITTDKTVLLLGSSDGTMSPSDTLALNVTFSDAFDPYTISKNTTITLPLTKMTTPTGSRVATSATDIITTYHSKISPNVPINVYNFTFSQTTSKEMPQFEGKLQMYVFYFNNKAMVMGLLQNISLHSPYGLTRIVRSLSVSPTQPPGNGAKLSVYGITDQNFTNSSFVFTHIRNATIANIFTGTTTKTFMVDTFNFTPQEKTVTPQIVTTEAETGATVDNQTVQYQLPFGKMTKPVTINWGKFGVFTLSVDGVTQTRYAHIPNPPANTTTGISFGLNYFWQQVPWQTYSPEIGQKLGQKWGRLWFGDEEAWYRQEWTKGQYDFSRLTKSLDTMDKYNQWLYYMFYTAPPWAKPHQNSPVWDPTQIWSTTATNYGVDFEGPLPSHLGEFSTYFDQLYQTVGGRIHLFDTGNEINTDCTWINTYDYSVKKCADGGLSLQALPSYEQFHHTVADYLRAKNYPGIVTGPSLAGTVAQNNWNWETQQNEGPWPEWIQNFGKLGGFTNTTAFSFHPYTGFDLDPKKWPAIKDQSPEINGVPTVLNDVRKNVDDASAKHLPLIMSEYGFPSDYSSDATQVRVNETNQANYIVRETVMGVGRGDVPMALYYALQDTGDNTLTGVAPSGYASFGLVYLGYTPKVSLAADAGMTAMLSGATGLGFASDITLPAGGWGYKFTDRTGNTVYVLWTEDTQHATVSIPLPVDLGRGVQIYDKYTNILQTLSNVTSGSVSVQIGPSPIYVVTGRNPVGYDGVDTACQNISGWVCDPSNNTQPIDVHVYLDGNPYINGGTYLGGVIANQMSLNTQMQKGIGNFCGGTSNHVFTFPIPDSVKDGRQHTLFAFGINIGDGVTNALLQPVSETATTVTCAPNTSSNPIPSISQSIILTQTPVPAPTTPTPTIPAISPTVTTRPQGAGPTPTAATTP